MNEHESFWAGEFGDVYTDRNDDEVWVARNIALFSRALACTHGIRTVLELGANRGFNLRALRQLLPSARMTGVEINAKAVEELRAIDGIVVQHCSLHDYQPTAPADLVVVKGVLIHLDPDTLPRVYQMLCDATGRYLFLCEYYNPRPTVTTYRGHENRLCKRDFAGELMDQHADMKLLDYGFVYSRDRAWPQDNVTWFVLEKDG